MEKELLMSELEEENRNLHEKVEKVYGEILPQISNSTKGIYNILEAKWFRRMISVHALLGALAGEPFINKLKILVKMALRVVGVKYDFLIDDYRMNIKIAQYLGSLDNIARIAQITVDRSAVKRLEGEKQFTGMISGTENVCIYAREPLVSVLLPVYNHAAFVENAIQGVLRQDYTNWELIILNDGSTDGLLDIISDYLKDSRIRIYTQDNQRLPNGLSNLHNLARGEFITWTSADNMMKENMLGILVEKLLKTPNAVMVYADVAVIDENGDFKTTGYREANRDPQAPYVLRLPHCTEALDAETDNFINACFMYRAEPVKALKGLYSADLEGLEDYDFWLRLKTFGDIVHLNNMEPLYYYRVHENTMSEDLLKNKLNEHIKRAHKMLEYSRKKDAFAEKNWKIKFKRNVQGAEALETALTQLNYAYEKESSKMVSFIEKDALGSLRDRQFAIVCDGETYDIYVKIQGNLEKRASIYAGYKVNVLAKKVRQTFASTVSLTYPIEFLEKRILGCHMDLTYIDVEKTLRFIQENPDVLFVFCTPKGVACKEIGDTIVKACKNAIFMGETSFGGEIHLYASWDALFVPPLKQPMDIMPMILLGWNTGRWVFVENDDLKRTFPLVTTYYYGEKLLGIKKLDQIGLIEDILDKYIACYSQTGAAQKIIRYLNGIGQDILVDRPDFKMAHKDRIFPPALFQKEFALPESLKSGYVGIMVDSLDKGGLEQVVALLAHEFRRRGLEVRLLCTSRGGEIADQLLADNFKVVIFHDNDKEFEHYLKTNRAILINTHYTKKMLNIVEKLDIPMIEVIHNMYVFQNAAALEKEKKIRQYFTKMIAVSSIAKEIYEKKVDPSAGDKIKVIGNAANSHKVVGLNRRYIRDLLGIPQNSLVFINVSSIDGRKNQIGLLKAFEIFNQTVEEDSYLILVGNVLSEYYDNMINTFIEQCTCKSYILKLDYHNSIGDLYNAADVFVMPSYYEGWSIAATEALYCGLPLIHSYCGSAPELIKDGENGIMISNPAGDIAALSVEKLIEKMNSLDPSNTDELVKAMSDMSEKREKWKEKRGIISADSVMNYNQSDMIENYIKEFSEVL